MRVTRILTTSVTAAALAFSMLASTIPANAATPGFHAAWVAQSAYVTGAVPGGVYQMSAVYQNTGDNPWVKGQLGTSQANFSTAAPRNNTTLNDAGWSAGQNWLAPNRYAAQANDLVATAQLGSWVWSAKVPAATPPGTTTFYGIPVIDGVTFMEDFGFFLNITVASPAITLSSNPASPSSNPQPTINGTGATAASTVTVSEGTTTLCTATATASGTFSCTTSALASGSHTISAADSAGLTSSPFTYVVSNTAPTVVSANAPNTARINVVFSTAMKNNADGLAADGATPTNYSIACTTAGAVGNPQYVTSSDGITFNLRLSDAQLMANPDTCTVTVTNVQDLAGNTVGSPNSATFSVSDTTKPTATKFTYNAAGTKITVSWSEPVTIATSEAVANYAFDGVSGTTAFTGCLTSVSTFSYSTTTCTLTTPLTTAGSHSLDIANVADMAGNVMVPQNLTATFTPDTGRPTVTAVSAPTATSLKVTYSEAMICTSGSTTAGNAGASQTYALTKASDGSAGPAITSTTGVCNAAKTSVTFTTAALTSGTAYNLTITGATDSSGNVINPNPTVIPVTFTADTTAPVLVGVTAVQTGATVTTVTATWNEAMSTTNAAGTNGACSATAGKADNDTATGVTYGGTAANLLSTAINASSNCAVSDPATTVTFTTTYVPAGTYSIKFLGATDLTGNAMATTTLNVTVVDTRRPTAAVTGSSATGKTITVTYDEPASGTGGSAGATSATNPANYKLDGVALPAGSTITLDATSTIATITLTGTAPIGVAGDPHALTISNVTDTAGNVINPNPTTSPFISGA